MPTIADTPAPPYCALVFTSPRTAGDNGYRDRARCMPELARGRPGFPGSESAREEPGISVACWSSLNAIHDWKAHAKHRVAPQRGGEWYRAYRVRVCRREKDYDH